MSKLNHKFVGVGGLCCDPDGRITSDLFPTNPFDSTPADVMFKHRIRGERFGMILTSIARQYPFPEVKGQFVPEGLPDLQMPSHFKRRYVNEVLRVYYPSKGGLSGSLTKAPAGRLYYYLWLLRNMKRYFWYSPLPFIKAALMVPVLWMLK